MKQSKNLNFSFLTERKPSLKEVVLFYIEKTIDIARFPLDQEYDSKVEYEISARYGFPTLAIKRMYHPVWWYLTSTDPASVKSRGGPPLIAEDGYGVLVVTERAKELTKSEKEKIALEIINERLEYYEANIEKFKLNISLQ